MADYEDERLRSLAQRLRTWLLSDEGFGSYLENFFRENSGYFDDYQEEHSLHYTALHKEFAAKLEEELQGWLRDEELSEAHLEAILQAGRDQETEEAQEEVDMVDLMLEAMDYPKWIDHIFRLKRRVRDRRKVRVRKAPPPAPPPAPPE
ncbi:Hypothetical protein SCF082_LOCUS16650 [Durusdinium trenchii]|uniref:BART domain-containing protein n=1 Tax=Durusdinium trenchii TaxID=1381693 RepID=A0ABP0KD01_9DINO